MATFDVGVRFEIQPLPFDAEATTFFAAGPVEIGVEYRDVDEASITAGFSAEDLAAVGANLAQGFDEAGVSLHVVTAGEHVEHLRFDCFEGDAHYHYIAPDSHQVIVPFDQVAGGDMLEWALRAIRTRLGSMLRFVGADELATNVDETALATAVDDAGELARATVARQRAALAAS